MAQYNLPEDINNEMIDEIIAQLEELDPELFQIIKMMGDVGKHVFVAGEWIYKKLTEKGWDKNSALEACNIAGQKMFFASDPWQVAIEIEQQAEQ
ncbi:MAG: hypothetical protein UT24_C0022G0025, partial [Candidatus Woesebacteria bacterium GW2011_GWB1_39_12]